MENRINYFLEKAKLKLVLVEGIKDKRALENLGFKKVITLKNRPLFEVVESINEKEIILLTDLDAEGKKLYSILSKGLQRRGIKIDNKLRLGLFKTGLRQVEALDEAFIEKCAKH
ncbi:MAG: toprim domain-containing protein [Candidatus Nanoarchaeia archaeon]